MSFFLVRFRVQNTQSVLHSDQGVQYSSVGYYNLLSQYSVVQSMSRAGNPYDNAIMESFYRTLKRELVQDVHYDNPEQARMDMQIH